MNDLRKLFAANLLDFRTKANLSQKQLAEAVGKTLRYIQLLEAAEYWPGHTLISDLAVVLGRTETDFFQPPQRKIRSKVSK